MKIRSKTVEPRDTTVNIRVSESEKDALKKAAAAVGLSVGAYLLGLAFGDSIGKAITEKPNPDQIWLEGAKPLT